MEVRIEDVSPVEKKLVVEVPWTDVAGKLGEAYRDLAKNVQLKGFRKGKVPRSVLERMFGARVKAEVAGQFVRESFITATSEHNLDAVSEPRIDSKLELKKGKPLAFEAIIEVKGEVVAKDYDGMELNKRPLKVDDEAIEASLATMQRENTDFVPIEGREILGESDIVSLKVKGKLGEMDIDRDDVVVDLADSEREPLPGLAKALVGLAIDAADHALELAIPEDHKEAEIAGKNATLNVTVVEAREKDMPALDDEFAKDTGRAETLDELRTVVRGDLEEAQAEQIKNEVREAALKELVARNPIPVAQSLVDRVIHNKFHRLQSMLGIHDPDHDHAGFTDDLKDKLSEGADDEVRGQLLIDAVATTENVEVTDGDVDERIEKISKGQGGQKASRLRAEMDRDGRLDNLRFQIRYDKTLDLLVSRATVTEKEPEAKPAGEDSAAAE